MKIAYVTETWLPSVDGVVTRLRATLRCLSELGHQALVIAPSGRGGSRRCGTAMGTEWDELSTYGHQLIRVPSVRLPFLAGGRPFGLPLGRRVQTPIETFGAELVHVVNPFWLARAGSAAARRLELPLVASFHQDLAMVAGHMRLGMLHNIIWDYTRRRYADAQIALATSQAMLNLLEHRGVGRQSVTAGYDNESLDTGRHPVARQDNRRLSLWPCGVDSERFHPRRRSAETRRRMVGADAGRTIALYTGRLAPEKGLERLYPLTRDPNVVLVVAGDGPLRPALERDLDGCSVRFTGWLDPDQLADVYAAADVFAFPSTTETLGFALIEALASGLPVLAADSPPTREIVGDTDAGTVLPAADWDEAAVTAIRRLGGPGRDVASTAARQQALQWDWMDATRQLTLIYDSVRNQDPPPVVQLGES